MSWLSSLDTSSEKHRRQCEARWRLKEGYTTPTKVKLLRKRITDQRGSKAADDLIEEMRVQWELLKKTKGF